MSQAWGRVGIDWRSLHHAARWNEQAAVTGALLDEGADPNARAIFHDDLTPLHLAACENTNPMVTALLLAAGANLHARDRDGTTPLHLAASRNENAEVVEVLLRAGADPNARNDYQATPLLVAASRSRNSGKAELLIRAGAEVDARATDNQTSLHGAGMAGCRRFARSSSSAVTRLESGKELDPSGGTGGVRPGCWGNRRRSGGKGDHATAGNDARLAANRRSRPAVIGGRRDNFRRPAARTFGQAEAGRTP